MRESKDHINIDLGFLDKKEPLRVSHEAKVYSGETPNSSMPVSSGSTYNWKKIIIIGGVVLFFIIVGNLDNSSSTSSSASSSVNTDNSVTVGKYSCSSYNASKADSLKPSDFTNSQLDIEKQNLDRRSQAMKVSASSIDADYVNEYSQASINSHNAKVDNYNTTLNTLKRDLQSFDTKTSQFNNQIDAYNNFLDKNCTKK